MREARLVQPQSPMACVPILLVEEVPAAAGDL
jgi:hypothetical protein